MMSIVTGKYDFLFSWKEELGILGEQTYSLSNIVEMRLQKL